jgi:hypothetical protein
MSEAGEDEAYLPPPPQVCFHIAPGGWQVYVTTKDRDLSVAMQTRTVYCIFM